MTQNVGENRWRRVRAIVLRLAIGGVVTAVAGVAFAVWLVDSTDEALDQAGRPRKLKGHHCAQPAKR